MRTSSEKEEFQSTPPAALWFYTNYLISPNSYLTHQYDDIKDGCND